MKMYKLEPLQNPSKGHTTSTRPRFCSNLEILSYYLIWNVPASLHTQLESYQALVLIRSYNFISASLLEDLSTKSLNICISFLFEDA